MLAQFLHFYPQYKLSDLRDGTVTLADFKLLVAGMTDLENPDLTEPLEDVVARKTREAHLASMRRAKGGGWS